VSDCKLFSSREHPGPAHQTASAALEFGEKRTARGIAVIGYDCIRYNDQTTLNNPIHSMHAPVELDTIIAGDLTAQFLLRVGVRESVLCSLEVKLLRVATNLIYVIYNFEKKPGYLGLFLPRRLFIFLRNNLFFKNYFFKIN